MNKTITSPVAIVANGTIRDLSTAKNRLSQYSTLIAVDGGMINCHLMGLSPQVIIGDLDSVPSELLSLYKDTHIIKLPIDKDKTDLEAAVELALEWGAQNIKIFGALEMRMDHSLYNLHLLCRFPGIVTIESDFETIFALNGKHIIQCHEGQTISMLPITGPVKGITTKGLKWELNQAEFNENFMSISNVALHPTFEVELKEGILLCCLITD